MSSLLYICEEVKNIYSIKGKNVNINFQKHNNPIILFLLIYSIKGKNVNKIWKKEKRKEYGAIFSS